MGRTTRSLTTASRGCIVGRKRKLSHRRTQRLIDELDLNFRLKDVKRSEKSAVLSTVGDKARIKYYQDKTARKKR